MSINQTRILFIVEGGKVEGGKVEGWWAMPTLRYIKGFGAPQMHAFQYHSI
ncbi:MAG: hypothetical protein RIG63_06255 [Coleofasciculus chthonoplastes F3-SA18-01]|uniref:hypothetical protein n=1 Tax=Coleofasciculus chthonoplastes TaxID=64178 RepID=UPI003301045A